MRIQHNISALNAFNKYSGNNRVLSKNLQKLSSGYRINSAADDAAGLAISEKMRSQIKGLDQAINNANDGISFVQTAEGALAEVSSMLIRMKELAVQSANGTYDDTVDRGNISKEVDALVKEIDRIGTVTNFNGKTLFDGTFETNGMTLHVGETGNAGHQVSVTLMKIASAEMEIADAVTEVGDQTDAAALIDKINTDINTVSSFRGKLGALQNRLDHTVNNLTVQNENITASESQIRDVDMAKEMTAFTKNNILVQAAQSMLAQANQLPQGVLQLLQ